MAALHPGWFTLIDFRAYVFNTEIHAPENEQNTNQYNKVGNNPFSLVPEPDGDDIAQHRYCQHRWDSANAKGNHI